MTPQVARRGMRASVCPLVLALLLAPALLAGPVGGTSHAYTAQVVDGVLEVEVPVPVVLVGFPAGFAANLTPLLDESAVRHGHVDHDPRYGEGHPPLPHRLAPIPRHQVHALPAATAAGFFANLSSTGLVSTGLYDAAAAEALLAGELANASLAPRAAAPTLVLLHAGGALPTPYAYRQPYAYAPLDGVRAFGERGPMVIVDTSAAGPATGGKPYEQPLDPNATGAPALVASLVRDAVEFRLLQGPIAPVPTHRCHAVTVVGAWRTLPAGALGPHAWERLDAARLRSRLADLAGGETVHVDVVPLPAGDPLLSVMAKAWLMGEEPLHPNLRGTDPDQVMDDVAALATTVDLLWPRYWVPRVGCEGYVLVMADGAATEGVTGRAYWFQESGHRVAVVIGGLAGLPQALNVTALHEVGHNFGLPHPVNVITPSGGGGGIAAFGTGHTLMSVALQGRHDTFGAIDPNNWARNRVAALFGEVGQDADPAELAPVLAALSVQDWRTAADRLEELRLVPRVMEP